MTNQLVNQVVRVISLRHKSPTRSIGDLPLVCVSLMLRVPRQRSEEFLLLPGTVILDDVATTPHPVRNRTARDESTKIRAVRVPHSCSCLASFVFSGNPPESRFLVSPVSTRLCLFSRPCCRCSLPFCSSLFSHNLASQSPLRLIDGGPIARTQERDHCDRRRGRSDRFYVGCRPGHRWDQ